MVSVPMPTLDARPGYLVAFLLVLGLFLQACSGGRLYIRSVPDEGYGQTTNYQFQARIHADSVGTCTKMVVRVRPVNKLYLRGRPPSRLQLFDDDCIRPLRFERVNYVSERTGEAVRLSGPDVAQFFSNHFRLENELIAWLFDEGVI